MVFPEQEEQDQQDEQAKRRNGSGVGALLKASRLRIGEDLRDISDILCIRNVYLEAIEDGRFDLLPGPTYATGFTRAYAEYLGLDSDEVVRRFKADSSGSDNKAELIFPEPIPDPGIPGGAIVFIGIVIAIMAYGAWYMNTSKGGFLVELISPVPERLAALGPDRKEQAAGSETPAKETAKEPAETPAAEAAPMPEPAKTTPVREAGPEAQTTAEATPEATPVPEAGPEAQTSPVPEAEPEAPTANPQEAAWASVAKALQSSAAGGAAPAVQEAAPEAQTTARAEPDPAAVREAGPEAQTAPEPVSPAEAVSAEPAAEPAAPVEPPTAPSNVPEDVIPEVQRPAERAAGTPEPSPVQEPGTGAQTASKPVSPAEPVAPAGAASAEQAAAPSVSGGGDDSRIVVRAKANSWIQIRDDIGKELLVTRLLRSGDSYAVPNRRGLKLSTGNAGALEILVDGKTVPSIGKEGTVRRGVALDADKLKAGTAVSE